MMANVQYSPILNLTRWEKLQVYCFDHFSSGSLITFCELAETELLFKRSLRLRHLFYNAWCPYGP